MRVGFVIYGSLDLTSGGFLYDRMLVRALRARGVAVEVMSLPWPRHYGRALLHNLGPWPRPDRRWDLVIQDQLVHPAVFQRNQHLRARGLPVVALVHNLTAPPDLPSAPPLQRAVEGRYLSELDGVIAVCERTRADVAAVLGGRPGPVSVVARAGRDHLPAPADAGAVAARALAPGPLRLLFVGTVMPHKGLHRLLAALPAPSSPASSGGCAPWTLDVAGSLDADPSYAIAARALAAVRGLADRVHFHGELGGAALWELYRRSHLLALPSDREAYSLACLEGLGFGLPVLVTSRGGMGEMIQGGGEGLLLDPEDSAAWRAAITRAAADRSWLAGCGRAALARFAAHGPWDHTARVVERFCAAVLGAAGGGAVYPGSEDDEPAPGTITSSSSM